MTNLKIDSIVSTVDYLQNQGFFRILNNDKSYSLLRIQDNVARLVGDFQLTDAIKNEFQSENRIGDLDKFMKSYNLQKIIKLLDYYDKPFLRDTRVASYFFFRNTGIKVKNEGIYKINTNNIEFPIWQSQVIESDFIPNNYRSDFSQFIEDVSGCEENKVCLETAIGYMLTDYKDPTCCPAIILTDQNNNTGQANGGTGKSLIMKAVSHMVKTAVTDGKNINRNFQFSNIDNSTKIIYLDDVEADFDFKKYYSITTGEMTVERKYENKFSIPFEESPKLIISSNYVVSSDGGSSDARRRVEIELSDYYGTGYTPEEKYGKRFFTDWSSEDWCSFYLYMMKCQQLFLKRGLQIPEVNIEKQIIKQTSKDFLDFCKENLKEGRNDKSLLFKQYASIDKSMTSKQFKGWLDRYCVLSDKKFNHQKSNGKNYLVIQ